MQVTVVTPMPLRRPIQGGVQTHVRNLTRSLGEKGHDTTVVSIGHRSESVFERATVRNAVGRSPAGDVAAAVRAIDATAPDVVHFHTVSPKVVAAAVLVQRHHPSITTIHGLPAEEWKYTGGTERYIKRFVGGFAQRHVVPRLHNRIAVSEYVADQFDVQTHVVSNGVDEQFFEVDPADRPDIEPRLLTVGTVHPRKGLDDAVAALPLLQRSVPDVQLDIVGGVGDRSYQEHLADRIAALDIEESVTFHGQVDGDRLRSLYGLASVFLFPSREESQGIAVLEAMATGTPVVGSDAAAVPAVVEKNEAGLVYPVGDVDTLAERLETLLCRDERYRHYQGCCRANAEGYRWSAVTDAVIDLYEQIRATGGH